MSSAIDLFSKFFKCLFSLIANFPSDLHNYVVEDVEIFKGSILSLYQYLTSIPQVESVYDSFFKPTNCTLGLSEPIAIPGLYTYLSEEPSKRAFLFYREQESICSNINIFDYFSKYSHYTWFIGTLTLLFAVRQIKQRYFNYV